MPLSPLNLPLSPSLISGNPSSVFEFPQPTCERCGVNMLMLWYFVRSGRCTSPFPSLLFLSRMLPIIHSNQGSKQVLLCRYEEESGQLPASCKTPAGTAVASSRQLSVRQTRLSFNLHHHIPH
jgi:hypothetical protein